MGTRSLTVFKESNGREIAVLYRQYDGYPEGHGVDLATFLAGKKIVNGISGNSHAIFNGMSDLAVRVITYMKMEIDKSNDAGNFYLYPAGTRDCGEDFIYEVSGTLYSEPRIKVKKSSGFVLYFGTASEVLNQIKNRNSVPVKEEANPIVVKQYHSTSGRTNYQVKLHSDGNLSCTCPDWKFRKSQTGGYCKHIQDYKRVTTVY